MQAEGETEVLVAGDPERQHLEKVKRNGGIHYHVNLLSAMVSMYDNDNDNNLFWHIQLAILKLHN